jgi:inhibitor of cysteine peptidase
MVACAFALGALWVPAAHAEARKIVRADDSFNGHQVELQVGETLEISLSENASTGFRWMAPPAFQRGLGKILHAAEPVPEAASGPPGKPGVRRFSFEAVHPGTVELELYYRRPWETAQPPARKFQIRVRVRAVAAP